MRAKLLLLDGVGGDRGAEHRRGLLELVPMRWPSAPCGPQASLGSLLVTVGGDRHARYS